MEYPGLVLLKQIIETQNDSGLVVREMMLLQREAMELQREIVGLLKSNVEQMKEINDRLNTLEGRG